MRTLGRSNIQVSAIGLGTARIGGLGYSRRLDRETTLIPDAVREAKRAIREAIDRGINLFDTADIYGAGRSERMLGEAIHGVRGKAVIATKFGELFDEETGEELQGDVTPEYVARACEASLRRLGVDTIDVYIFHLRDFPLDQSISIRDALEDLVSQGKIRFYGWSTDDAQRAKLFAAGPHCTVIEHRLSVFERSTELLTLGEQENLASLIRAPFMCGVLTGRWHPDTKLPEADRRSDWFKDKGFLQFLDRAESLRPILTRDGRSYVQGILAWVLAKSPRAIPIPGFRTTEQVLELTDVLRHGPMSSEDVEAITGQLRANE